MSGNCLAMKSLNFKRQDLKISTLENETVIFSVNVRIRLRSDVTSHLRRITNPRIGNFQNLCVLCFCINLPYNTPNCLMQKGCKIKLRSVERKGDLVKCRCYDGVSGRGSTVCSTALLLEFSSGHSGPFICWRALTF